MARKLCNICNTRPVDAAAGISDACVPCYDEGTWENQHQDDRHDELNEILAGLGTAGAVELRKLAPRAGVKNAGQFKSAELRVKIREAIEATEAGCWICHLELNEARKPKRAASTGEKKSRVGQKINVPMRAPGELKAAVVVKAAGESNCVLQVLGGDIAVLEVQMNSVTIRLAWDAFGRYDYASSAASVNGHTKKVRNVAEALRLITGA